MPSRRAEKGIKDGNVSAALGELVSNPLKGGSAKGFVYLLLVLAVVAGSLFTIFSFLATAQVGEAVALVLFLAVAGLLIVGYMVGLMVLGLAMVPAAMLVGKRRDRRSVTQPTQS